MPLPMAKNKNDKPPKPPKANRSGVPRSIYFPADIDAALVAYRNAQKVPPNVTDIVLVAVQEFLKGEGYYPPPAEEKK